MCFSFAEEGSNIDPDNLKALVTPEKFAEIFNLNTDEPDACVLVGNVDKKIFLI